MALPLVSSQGIDPTLASLFSSSAGPTSKPSFSSSRTQQQRESVEASSSSEASIESDDDEKYLSSRARKRRRDEADNVEGAHLHKLALEEEKEANASKRQKSGESFSREKTADESQNGEEEDEEMSDPPQHESLAPPTTTVDDEKNLRTAFLSNVSSTAITSRSARKLLETHLTSFTLPSGAPKISSLRFRSTAYSDQSLPKRASFAKRDLMASTAASTNAYVVYTTLEAVVHAVQHLNGTICLDRHLRVDSVADPSKPDHRRCVFVGNLDFVDDASAINQANEVEGEKPKRKKSKPPADVEEGLWRQFSKAGEVESVRVVRDQKTRVGKGFAYVQFKDANAVESALLFNDKKFPPLLPRQLRVTRAKKITNRPKPADLEGSEKRGRKIDALDKRGRHPSRDSFPSKPGSSRERRGRNFGKEPKGQANPSASKQFKGAKIVFEGHRASSGGVAMKLKPNRAKKVGKSSKGGKLKKRSSRRGAEWKKMKKGGEK